MLLFTESNLAETLRKKCDEAKDRIWVVSPFVGDTKDIDCILGTNWSNSKIDRKLLFDAVSGSMSKHSLSSFINSGIKIKSLHSIHAKMYIVDNWCLLTSANLTASAFSKRYEIGNTLESLDDLEGIVSAFNRWWDLAESVNIESNINEIKTNNNFKQIHELPSINTNEAQQSQKRPRRLREGEYRINGVNIMHNTISGRKCLLLNCKTSNHLYFGHSFVAIYDTEIIKRYETYMWLKGKTSLNYNQCEDLPEKLRYISYMKSKTYSFGEHDCYIRRFINNVSRGTYGAYLDDYDGWEYECAMSQPPPPTGIWWVDKAEEEEWEKNPFPSKAYPAQHFHIEVFVCCKSYSDEVEESTFEEIKKHMMEDFYDKYTPQKFPDRINRMH